MGHTGGGRRYGLKPVRNRRDDALARMDPLAFERLMGDYYRRQGYRVEDVGTGGRARLYDGGIDLKLYKDGAYTVVQCKRENAYQITHNVVHELLGVMLTEGASKAVVVTTGEFTDAAWRKAANEGRLQLIDGTRLRELLGSLLPVEPASPPDSPSLAASYWEVTAPYRAKRERERAEHAWIPVGDRLARRRRKQGDASGAVVVVAVVLAMLMWQCSRKAPAPSQASSRPAQVQPAFTSRPEAAASPVFPPKTNAPVASSSNESTRAPAQRNGLIAPPPRPRMSDGEAVQAYLESTPEM